MNFETLISSFIFDHIFFFISNNKWVVCTHPFTTEFPFGFGTCCRNGYQFRSESWTQGIIVLKHTKPSNDKCALDWWRKRDETNKNRTQWCTHHLKELVRVRYRITNMCVNIGRTFHFNSVHRIKYLLHLPIAVCLHSRTRYTNTIHSAPSETPFRCYRKKRTK